MSSIKINGKTFSKGDTITFNDDAQGICYGPRGLTVEIKYIQQASSNTRSSSVGLYSPHQRIDGWSDLDGDVGHHRGWWINSDALAKCIQESDAKYTVSKAVEHHGVQLKDKSCLMLAHLDDGLIFVEFEEDVNGCSADGLGKAGHCVALKSNVLTKKKRVKHAE